MPPTRRTAATRQARSTPLTTNDHFDDLTTGVLRLRFDQQKLSAIGSRETLLARLRSAPRAPQPTTSSDPAVADNDATAAPTDSEPTQVGGFTLEQFDTLKSLISSSIREALPPQSEPVLAVSPVLAVPPEPAVPVTSTSFPPHLPAKIVSSIRNGEYVDFNNLLPENVDGTEQFGTEQFETRTLRTTSTTLQPQHPLTLLTYNMN